MCTTTESGSDGSNASLVISDDLGEVLVELVRARPRCAFHFRMKLVVGTMITLPA